MPSYRDSEGNRFNVTQLNGPAIVNTPNGEMCIPAGWVLVEPIAVEGQETLRPFGMAAQEFQRLIKAGAATRALAFKPKVDPTILPWKDDVS